MSKSIRHILLIVAMLSMALVGVAHANAPTHDSADCAVCIYQPNTDLHNSPNLSTIVEPLSFVEQPAVWTTLFSTALLSSPYFGRAPPFSA